MFREEDWRAQEQKFKTMAFTKQESRHFNRMFFAGAVDVSPDKQGRFIIPDYLNQYAGIKKDAIIIGVSNRIEIWDRQTWVDFYGNVSGRFEQISGNIINI